MANENTTKTTICSKCGGFGKLRHYSHIAEGVCFACSGSGQIVVRYTAAPVVPVVKMTVAEARYHVQTAIRALLASLADGRLDPDDSEDLDISAGAIWHPLQSLPRFEQAEYRKIIAAKLPCIAAKLAA